MSECENKLEKINALMAAHQVDAILLRKISSFAWVTCGAASYVNTAAADGAASILITANNRFILTNNIEAARMETEEKLSEQGWEIRASPWYSQINGYESLTGPAMVGTDGAVPGYKDLSAEIARLRADLTPEEGGRFRALGRDCAMAMDAAIRAVKPGMAEFEIAALLAYESQKRNMQPIVNLVASDERVFSYRHPLPTTRQMERYAMLVLCGRRQGLVCSITRLVHFGKLPPELVDKSRAVAFIDAVMNRESRPGVMLGQFFSQIQEAYARTGFADEWKYHHQGGAAGYEPREYLAVPGSTDLILSGQAYAWNPSIRGTKSEDTILVGEAGNEVITEIDGWPVHAIELDGEIYPRPAILEVL